MTGAAVLPATLVRLLGACVRRVHYRLLDPRYDRRHGIQTGGMHYPDQLAIESENARHSTESGPTPVRLFARILRSLGDIDFRRFTFVDIGSGKGRLLLLASQWPFARVEGVEFARELYEITLRNIERFAARGHRCDHIAVHGIDAADYRIPDGPCVFYLFHPFAAPVLARVLDNIEASYRAKPRDLYVIFYNPKFEELVRARPFLRPVQRSWAARWGDLLLSPHPITVYRAGAQP